MYEQCENTNELALCELTVILMSREYCLSLCSVVHISDIALNYFFFFFFFLFFFLLSDGVEKSVVMWNIPAVSKILLPGCRQSFLIESLLPAALWNAVKNVCFG